MKKLVVGISLLIAFASCTSNSESRVISDVPDLTMPDNGLRFKEIEDYKNYRIVATHFRTDKNEIHNIFANEKAFKAFKDGGTYPEGSKVVKIGWDIDKMTNFEPAIEAKDIQRIEYMIKDSIRFPDNPGHWGYARFVKTEGKYSSWEQGTADCIACHNLAKDHDFLFTRYQKLQ